jgi:hypothetical protein
MLCATINDSRPGRNGKSRTDCNLFADKSNVFRRGKCDSSGKQLVEKSLEDRFNSVREVKLQCGNPTKVCKRLQ